MDVRSPLRSPLRSPVKELTMPIANPTVFTGTLTDVSVSPEITGYGVDIYGSGTGTINIESKLDDGSWQLLEALTEPSRTFDPATKGTIRLNSTVAPADFDYELRARVDKIS